MGNTANVSPVSAARGTTASRPSRKRYRSWTDEYDRLHKPGRPMEGPWTWEIHDYSMATLCGGGEDSITGFIMDSSPCRACADRAAPKEWMWGRCTTPSLDNARLIAASPDLLVVARAVVRLQGASPELRKLARAAVKKALKGDGGAEQPSTTDGDAVPRTPVSEGIDPNPSTRDLMEGR